MSTSSQIMVGGFQNNPTLRFIALLQKPVVGKYSDEDYKALLTLAKELKAVPNAHWIKPLKQKLVGASDECYSQICAIWETITENNDSAKLTEKELTEVIKHVLDKYLSNQNNDVLAILTMLWAYGWCSIEIIAHQMHTKINRSEPFYKRFCLDSIQWSLTKIIKQNSNSNINLQGRLNKLFSMLNREDLSSCTYQLFSLIYTYSIKCKGVSFDNLVNIKITNKKDNELINGILDFFLAITLSSQDLENKTIEIIKLVNKIKLVYPDNIKFSDSTLNDYIQAYVDKLGTELTNEHSELISRTCDILTQEEQFNIEKYPLLDILFQLEKQFEFYFINAKLEVELTSISKATSELTLAPRTASPKSKTRPRVARKLTSNKDSSPEGEKSTSSQKSSKNDSPSDASAIRFRLSRSDADDQDNSPVRLDKSPIRKDEAKTPSPHSSSEGIALKKSRPRNLLNFNETISPENLKFAKERFMKYKPKPSRDNLLKSKSSADEILSAEDEIIVNDDEYQENERNIRAVGIWGEAALFLQLKEKYFDKYQITDNTLIISRADGFILKIPPSDNNPKKITEIEVKWPNKALWEEWLKSKKEQAFIDPASQPYDLTITKKYADGKITINYAEVKSTPGNTKQKIPTTLTGKEFRFMMANKDHYRMYRCFLAGTENPIFVKHKNLADELVNKECEIKEIRFTV